MRFVVAIVMMLLAAPLPALEIRVHPGKELYLYETDARRGLSTVMLQNVAVVQNEGEAVSLRSLTIELVAAERVRQTLHFGQEDLAKSAARMAALKKAGALELYDFAFQTSRYLGKDVEIAQSETLQPKSALILISTPLLVPRGVDGVRVIARGLSGEKNVEATLHLPLRHYEQRNDYRFPLTGPWVTVVGPGLSEPHRWALNEEFALDIVRIGATGKTCRNQCTELDDYYGWGEDVVAAADGTVIAIETAQPETADRFRKPGESGDAFMQRTMAAQDQLLAKGAAGVAGNHVVIRHEGGEFSHYVHLASGSVLVKPGESVKRGQKIAKLGHSGNSTEPHLHFTVADGPDPLYSRSLPVRFSGLTTVDGPQPPVWVQSGWIVEAK